MGTKWVTSTVKAGFGWPKVRIEFTYCGRRFLLRPETDTEAPSLSVYAAKGQTMNEGVDLISRALSALAWAHSTGAEILFSVGSNTREPVRVGKGHFRHVSEPWEHIYLPKPRDKRARRALAIFREALSLNSTPYKFLGLYKILNIRFPHGPAQEKWINANLTKIKDPLALERLTQLSSVTDLGAYLYRQGRCAVAHAFSRNVVDPDISKELRRLEYDVPLMKALAELMISTEFGILTESDFWASLRSVRRMDDFPPEYVKAKQAPAP